MLIRYFFYNFLTKFLIFFSILITIFTSCNLFIRFPIVYTYSALLLLSITMLPLMAYFSLPLAASMSLYTTIAEHINSNALMLTSYLRSAYVRLWIAVGTFIMLLGLFYMILTFQWAPQSYQIGKQLLFSLAQDHILSLESNRFHTPFPGVNFFFKTKKTIGTDIAFSKILLTFTTRKKGSEKSYDQYFFAAKTGSFSEQKFRLYNGTMYSFKDGKYLSALFDETEIDINHFINRDSHTLLRTQTKFLTYIQLYQRRSEHEAFFELHKRASQIIWLVVQLLIIFCISINFQLVSTLVGIILAGILYLFSHIAILTAQAYNYNDYIMYSILYALPLLTLIIIYVISKRDKLTL